MSIQKKPGRLVISVSNRQKATVIGFTPNVEVFVDARLGLALALYRGEAQEFAEIIRQNLRDLEAERPVGAQSPPPEVAAPSTNLPKVIKPDPQPVTAEKQAEIDRMSKADLKAALDKVGGDLSGAADQIEGITGKLKVTSDPEARAALISEANHLAAVVGRMQGDAKALQESAQKRVKQEQLNQDQASHLQPSDERAKQLQEESPSPMSPTQPSNPPTTTPIPAPPGTPASWLRDPVGKFQYRYWDGNKWTEHVSGSEGQTTDFL